MKTEVKQHPILFAFAMMIIVFAGIKFSSAIIVPFLLAVFLSIMSYPLVETMMRYRLPKSVSVILSMSFIVGIVSIVWQMVDASLRGFTDKLPFYKDQLMTKVNSVDYIKENALLEQSSSDIMATFEPSAAMSVGVDILMGLGDVLGNALLIVLVVMFMLLEADILKDKVLALSSEKGNIDKKVSRFIHSVKHYMAIKTVISLATGIMVGTALWLLDVNHFALWGLLAFLFNFIPTVGSIIAAIPPVLLAFLQFDFSVSMLVLSMFVSINMIVGNFIEPKFMGKGLGLSTLVVLLSLIFWGYLLGSAGMLLSVPLTMVIKIACDQNKDWHWFAVILSDKAEEDKRDELCEITS
jgi:predicted PurR-regulated permease PerM